MIVRMGCVMPVARLMCRAARAGRVRLRVLFQLSREFRFAVRAAEQHIVAFVRQAMRRVRANGHTAYRIAKRLAGGRGVMFVVLMHGFALRV